MQFKQSDFEIETNLEYKKFKMLPKKCKSNSCYSNRTIYQGLSVILLLFIECNHAFNLSPHPHIVLREPTDLKSFMTKTRSSYFGFSINLKRDRWVSEWAAWMTPIQFILNKESLMGLVNLWIICVNFWRKHCLKTTIFLHNMFPLVIFIYSLSKYDFNGWMKHILIRLSKYFIIRSRFIIHLVQRCSSHRIK